MGEKDAFTRMKIEKERVEDGARKAYEAKAAAKRKKSAALATVRADLFALFSHTNPWERGKALEGVLNRLFKTSGVAVREAFAIKGNEGEGIVEQIDGLIELDGHLYLVEMKWHADPLGVDLVSQHLVRVFNRGNEPVRISV